MNQRNWQLPAHVGDELQTAQLRVYRATADAADARAALASAEVELGEALTQLNRVIDSLLNPGK
jgi:hypothetical protein